MKLVSIIVPCYNEGKVIEKFYSNCSKVLSTIKGYEFEYIFVDDGSKDFTLSIIKKISSIDKRVKFVSFSRNFGKEAAMLSGLRNAAGDYVVIMDADLQHPPEILNQMIQGIEDGYDSVAARRVKREGDGAIRKYCSKTFFNIINKISDVNIKEGATDYRMMTRMMVQSVISLEEYHRFTKGIFEWVGYNTLWIEYECQDRCIGESKWSFWSLTKYAIEGIVSFSTIPLKISSIIGTLLALVSFIYLMITFLKTLIRGVDMPGYASTMCMITFIGGVQLIALGIIGEYISRVYMESKRRPLYFEKESNIEENDKLRKEM